MKIPHQAIDKIQLFILERLEEAKAEGLVFGLSGGLDSAVLATLAVKALGDKAHALFMPERGLTDPADRRDSKKLAQSLALDWKKIEINSFIREVRKAVPELAANKIAWGNVKARARMILLYAHSNLNQWLVAGAANRSELLLGYFTRWGDGGADCFPLGGLFKSQVRELARKLGIPEQILKKKPSAGLWRGQTDEKELGASYKEIDPVLKLLVKGYKPSKIAKKLDQKEFFVKRIKRRIKWKKFKQSMPSVCKF